jgi:coenzyme PQQ biosynthesis protein B
MHMKILGAAAGDGLPQWNCGCRNCADARAGRLPLMTQSSVAVSADGVSWVLLNASPDIRAKLAATPALHPRGLRDTPVAAIVATNADVDHIAGLLTLREKTGFALHATPEIGGCRCQAMVVLGDARAPEPVCRKSPGRAALDALLEAEKDDGGGAHVHRRA